MTRDPEDEQHALQKADERRWALLLLALGAIVCSVANLVILVIQRYR